MRLRGNAHVTDVIADEHDLYGAGVNLAARLLQLADSGGIVVSGDVRDRLVPGLDAGSGASAPAIKHRRAGAGVSPEPARCHGALDPARARRIAAPGDCRGAGRHAAGRCVQQLLGDAVADE